MGDRNVHHSVVAAVIHQYCAVFLFPGATGEYDVGYMNVIFFLNPSISGRWKQDWNIRHPDGSRIRKIV